MCTMNAMPNNGVARLTIGIDTKAAMNRPARKTVPWCALAQALCLGRRPEAHGGELEIFAAEEVGGGEEEDHRPETREQQERQRHQIDATASSAVLMPSSGARRAAAACRAARPDSRLRSTSSAMSSTKKLATSAVTAGIRKTEPTMMPSAGDERDDPGEHRSGSAGRRRTWSRPSFRPAREPDQQAMQPDPGSTISSRASPIDFSSTARNGGENIWDKAWAAASSIMELRTAQR